MSTDLTGTPVATTTQAHPLTPLATEEYRQARALLEHAGLVTEATRFSYFLLREPEKAQLRAWEAGGPLPHRELSVLLTDLATAAARIAFVDLTAGEVLAEDLDTARDGQAPFLDEEYQQVEDICKADPEWVAALARRGLTDLDQVKVVALTAGVFGYDDEVGRRVHRALAFVQTSPTDLLWAHPVDGLVAHVDATSGTVLRLIETGRPAVPGESGDYLDPEVSGPMRTTLRPISITQPEGVSFTLDGDVLEWQNWSVRLGFNGREGLTLHQLAFDDGGERRSIIHRASISEMVVNYGDPTPEHGWQNYFDVGEYQFGRLANSLELGCDCLGEIVYRDAVVADDHGHPTTIRNAICIHEEDAGILWKHTESYTGTSAVRRQRRLVISFFTTIGNYDYGFYWYLYLDGTIQLECKATGIVFTGAHPGGDYPYSTALAPGLGAPVHQHLFSARLDMEVDGPDNCVDEVDVAPVPMGEGNPFGNAFTRRSTRLRTEQVAQREAAGHLGRVWSISSASRTNRIGEPTAYVLYPEGRAPMFNDPASSSRARATFAEKHLWVTRYARDELWAAGYAVNQNPGGAGLPAYAAADRDVDGQDLVVWHSFGLTHFPRLEDWPVMPVDLTGFVMKPHGFFDRNPTLDVPATAPHCAPGGAGCGCGCG